MPKRGWYIVYGFVIIYELVQSLFVLKLKSKLRFRKASIYAVYKRFLSVIELILSRDRSILSDLASKQTNW
jgi:hypothetical protein